MPPTPTPFPAGNPQMSLPTASLWDYSDLAIQGWNWAGTAGTVIQALFLLFVVAYGAVLLHRYYLGLVEANDESGD